MPRVFKSLRHAEDKIVGLVESSGLPLLLVGECVWRMETSGTLQGCKFKSVMASYGIISLGKKLTHNCLSTQEYINEYLVIDWGGKGL